jgi:hypothetical protein
MALLSNGPRNPSPLPCKCGSNANAVASYESCTQDGVPYEGGYYFSVLIMCGDCLEWRRVVASDKECQRWDLQVNERAMDAIQRNADALNRERFEEEAERFIAALHVGAILPEDFS